MSNTHDQRLDLISNMNREERLQFIESEYLKLHSLILAACDSYNDESHFSKKEKDKLQQSIAIPLSTIASIKGRTYTNQEIESLKQAIERCISNK